MSKFLFFQLSENSMAMKEVLQLQNKLIGNNWTKSMTAEYAPLHHYCRLLYFIPLNR